MRSVNFVVFIEARHFSNASSGANGHLSRGRKEIKTRESKKERMKERKKRKEKIRPRLSTQEKKNLWHGNDGLGVRSANDADV